MEVKDAAEILKLHMKTFTRYPQYKLAIDTILQAVPEIKSLRDKEHEIMFTITGELGTLNEYITELCRSLYHGNREKQIYTDQCHWQLKAYARDFRLPAKHNITFIWFRKTDNYDHDNVCFAKKYVLDGMVKSGLIPDDRAKYVGDFIDIFSVDPKNPRVEVVCTEVKEDD